MPRFEKVGSMLTFDGLARATCLLKSLKKVLVAGPLASGFATDVWTLPRVRRVVADQFGVKLSESQIWRVLRKMGFSPQRPSKRALQRDDKAAKEWKTKRQKTGACNCVCR
jgi:transposase